MSNHGQLPTTDAHTPFRWIWADSAEKTAQTVTVDDISKVGVQEDDGTLYLLQDLTPTWLQVGGSSGTLLAANNLSDVADRQTALDNLGDAAGGVNGQVLSLAGGNIGWSTPSAGGNSHDIEDAVTAAVTDAVTLTHTSTGTTAAGFGTGLSVEAENSGGTTVEIGRLTWKFDSGGDEDAIFSIWGRDGVNGQLDQMAVIRKGYGDFFVPAPDASAYIGIGSVDFQQGRYAATQTAQGSYGSILGGKKSTIEGAYSTIAGGYGNSIGSGVSYGFIGTGGYNAITGNASRSTIVSGRNNVLYNSPFTAILTGDENRISGLGNDHSVILSGNNVEVKGTGIVASGNENAFNVFGSSQGKLQVIRSKAITHSTTAWEIISNGVAVPTDGASVFDILVIGLDSGATNRFGYRIEGMVVNDGGTTTLLNSTVTTIHETDANFNVRVVADDPGDQLDVEVQDTGSSGLTIRWVFSARTVDTLFA